MKKTIHKTIIQIEILHEEPENISDFSLGEIAYNVMDGEWSHGRKTIESNVVLTGMDAVNALKEQGSDREFFGMDDEGNELED